MAQVTFSRVSTYVYSAGFAGAAVLATAFSQEDFSSPSKIASAFSQGNANHERLLDVLIQPWVILVREGLVLVCCWLVVVVVHQLTRPGNARGSPGLCSPRLPSHRQAFLWRHLRPGRLGACVCVVCVCVCVCVRLWAGAMKV